jgi:hypothetical protein
MAWCPRRLAGIGQFRLIDRPGWRSRGSGIMGIFPGRGGTRRAGFCGVSMTVHQSVLELIGRTPVVRAQRMDTGLCELFLKLESTNPGGSIKDRIGLSMVEGAEKAGKIKPGDTLVEGTAGWAWPWSRSRRATG